MTGARWMLAGALFGCAVAVSSYAGTTDYTYDVHGRLKVVTSLNHQATTTYTLDNAGNRQAVVVTLVDTTPPNPPTNPTATAMGFDTIRVSWTTSQDVGGGPVSYYRVYRGGTLLASPNGPPFDDWPLQPSTTYSYQVSAVDPSDNESARSASASATTGADTVPPSAPTNLQGVAASETQVNLTWSPSTDTGGSGLAGYEIFRDNGGTPIGTSSVTSYSDQTVTVATTHSYQVRAYDGAGNRSGFSNQISVTTPDQHAPSAPGNPTFSAITGTTATATWTAANDNVWVTGYRYSLNGGSSWTYPGNVLSANLTGLSLSTQYTMLVQAGDAAGNWGPSGSGTFTTSSFYSDNGAFVGTTWGYNPYYSGYSSPTYGSLTPSTLSGGRTVTAFVSYYQVYCGDPDCITYYYDVGTILTVTGFSGNPGANWLSSVSHPSVGSLTGSSAYFYCSSGTCSWSWATYIDLSGSSTLTVVHQ